MGAVPLAIGGFLGYQAAYSSSVGGFGGGMTAAFLVFAIGGLVVVAGLAGIAISLVPPWRGGWSGRYAFVTAGLLALGGVGGGAAVPLLDLGYHDPVILQARGEAAPTLTGVTGFEPNPAGRVLPHRPPSGVMDHPDFGAVRPLTAVGEAGIPCADTVRGDTDDRFCREGSPDGRPGVPLGGLFAVRRPA